MLSYTYMCMPIAYIPSRFLSPGGCLSSLMISMTM